MRGKKLALGLSLMALLVFPALGVAADDVPKLTDDEWKLAKQTYFNRCAGCHGTLRKGATGPDLLPKKTRELGTEVIEAFITEGTGGGMPGFVKMGILTAQEANVMARFVQNDPVAPPEISLADMKDTWKILVPVDKRPKKPEHTRNWQNYFGVVLRDAGKVAIFDGDTKENLGEVPTGFAVHILRSGASGRYFYSIGRDGKATMIDLWTKTPTMVAEVKACSEARSIETSKYKGYEDKLAIIGCYWPPHFVILDGQTLEPKKIVSTRGYTVDTNEYHPEPRVAAIVPSHYTPEWALLIKEAGFLWMVDYSNIRDIRIKMIEGERFLHDGGWNATKRYFMAAANMKDTMVIFDTKLGKFVTKFKVGTKPHPGRGANWIDPKYGPVSGTVHLGEGMLSVWGSDPEKHPEHAWKVVRSIELKKGSGSLFLKTHPKSKHLWMDFPLNPEPSSHRSVCVLDITQPEKEPKCFDVGDHGRVVHFEYNKNGDEVWISVWDKIGEVVVYDDKTLKVKTVLKDLVTPTGHFNVYNTMKDIY
jgi:nitrite reductase (NO-forming)/hydroxylamine reductase